MGKIKNTDIPFKIFEIKLRCTTCGHEFVAPVMDIPEIRELFVKGQPTASRCRECHKNNRTHSVVFVAALS